MRPGNPHSPRPSTARFSSVPRPAGKSRRRCARTFMTGIRKSPWSLNRTVKPGPSKSAFPAPPAPRGSPPPRGPRCKAMKRRRSSPPSSGTRMAPPGPKVISTPVGHISGSGRAGRGTMPVLLPGSRKTSSPAVSRARALPPCCSRISISASARPSRRIIRKFSPEPKRSQPIPSSPPPKNRSNKPAKLL